MRMRKVLAILKANSIFNVLNEKNVQRQPIDIDEPFEPRLPDGAPLRHRGAALRRARQVRLVSGRQGASRRATTGAGDTLGLESRDKATGKYFYFLAACAEVTDELKAELAGAPLVFFDGTVWRDDELIVAGLGNKTGQEHGTYCDVRRRRRDRGLADLDYRQEDISAYQQFQPGAAARFARAQSSSSARAGKYPPTERRSCCERRVTDWNDRLSVGKRLRSTAPRSWKRRCAISARRAITACIRSISCCTAAS